MIKLLIALVFHLMGVTVSVIWDFKNGNFEYASKYGDGIDIATPADILFEDLFLWEIEFVIFLLEAIGMIINNFFNKKYRNNKI